MATTVGRLMASEVLGIDVGEPLTSDKLESILRNIIEEAPEKYRGISNKLLELGGNAAFEEGATLKLSDTIHSMPDRQDLFDHVKKQQRQIEATDVSKEEKDMAIASLYNTVYTHIIDENYKRELARHNPFALQVKSKARGNKQQLSQLMATPGMFSDGKGKIIPLFINRSYAEGLSPAEFWAASYGARKGVKSTKFATADAGEVGKQMVAAAMTSVVTANDCGTATGIPVKSADEDNLGSVLARDTGNIPAGTVITRPVMDALSKFKRILVRSPITCGLSQGVCKQCVGIRETGDFPEIGAYIGVTAASALAERIAQASLNVKHGGAKQVKDEDDYSGFPMVEQFLQIPEKFRNSATLAKVAGQVERIEEAPQGGSNVWINNEAHYVLPGHDIKIKVGDEAEAGDKLSSGLVNPADIITYKGLGEGRRYFAEQLTSLLKKSGWAANRRNVEVISRALADHVTLDDDTNSGLPGDTIAYSNYAFNYRPRKDAKMQKATNTRGTYLEQPVLHYTIGTPINKSVIDNLNTFGIKEVMVHPDPPAFTPFMPSLRSAPFHEKDWMAQLGSSYLSSNLLKNVHRGAVSSTKGLHPLPGIAKGVDFGITG